MCPAQPRGWGQCCLFGHQILTRGLSGQAGPPSPRLSGRQLLLGEDEREELEGKKGNTKSSGSRPFQNLRVWSVFNARAPRIARGLRQVLNVCSVREGTPVGKSRGAVGVSWEAGPLRLSSTQHCSHGAIETGRPQVSAAVGTVSLTYLTAKGFTSLGFFFKDFIYYHF